MSGPEAPRPWRKIKVAVCGAVGVCIVGSGKAVDMLMSFYMKGESYKDESTDVVL